MKEKVMAIVIDICNTPTNCRGLENNLNSINQLFALKGIDLNTVNIYEMPLNWNDQVSITYEVIETKEQRELFAGIGTDGQFYFEDGIPEDF